MHIASVIAPAGRLGIEGTINVAVEFVPDGYDVVGREDAIRCAVCADAFLESMQEKKNNKRR
jgi:hypothetical protein